METLLIIILGLGVLANTVLLGAILLELRNKRLTTILRTSGRRLWPTQGHRRDT